MTSGNGTVNYLLNIIDDRSHIDIANVLLEHATTANAVKALKDAFIQKGRIPASVKTNQGCQFKVQFGDFLKQHNIEH
ncbi:MAG: transposase family protein [Clostridia bacterium]|nr:transposase family protein [Clostridia bacterium]